MGGVRSSNDRGTFRVLRYYAAPTPSDSPLLLSLVVTSCVGYTRHGREIERALGAPPSMPTFLGTDNKANLLVAIDAGSAARSKHFLRTYYTLRQRTTRREIELGHIVDEQNPADFLTKWVGKQKLDASVDYATNRHAPGAPPTPS